MLKDYPVAFSARLAEIEQDIIALLGSEARLKFRLMASRKRKRPPLLAHCEFLAFIESSGDGFAFRTPTMGCYVESEWLAASGIPLKPGRYPLPAGMYAHLVRQLALALIWADKLRDISPGFLATEIPEMLFCPRYVVPGDDKADYYVDRQGNRFPLLARFSCPGAGDRVMECPVLVVGQQGDDYMCVSMDSMPLDSTDDLAVLDELQLVHPEYYEHEVPSFSLTGGYGVARIPARYIDQPESWYLPDNENYERHFNEVAHSLHINTVLTETTEGERWSKRLLWDWVVPAAILGTVFFIFA